MTGLNWRRVPAAAIASVFVVLAVTPGAQAHDEGRWEREHWEREHRAREHRDREHEEHRHHSHRHHYESAPRVVYERPPVTIMPAPVYAPVYQAPAYPQPMNPSLNLNFTVPLQ